MSKQPIEYLRHILDGCRFIISATSGMTKEQLFRCFQRVSWVFCENKKGIILSQLS